MTEKIFKLTESDKHKIRDLVVYYTTHKCSEGVLVYGLEKILNHRGRYTIRFNLQSKEERKDDKHDKRRRD